MAIARERGSSRIAQGIDAVAEESAAWAPTPAPWSRARSRAGMPPLPPVPAPAEKEQSVEAKREWLAWLVRKYLIKVEQERTARLAGDVVAADFYVRQMTWLEVMLDLADSDGFRVLADFRENGHDLIDIAETPMSRLLGAARRQKWAELGEPPRPEHPPRDRLVDHGRFRTEPLEATWGGLELSHEQQRARFDEQRKRDAKAQLEWEAEARRDYERRRTTQSTGADQ